MSWMEDLICESLSEEQKEAVTSRQSRCVVVAGAGAGKTRVIVKRFVYILFQLGMKPSNLRKIVAITFTKKAATEMRDRLRGEMERIVQVIEEKGTAEEYQSWNQVRQRLGEAQVYTIHAYCQSVLVREPIVTGIDPFFQVLEDREAHRLLEQSVTHVLSSSEILHQRTPIEREWWIHYLSLLGWERAESMLVELSKKWNNLGWSLTDLVTRTYQRLFQDPKDLSTSSHPTLIDPSQTEEYGIRLREWIRWVEESEFKKTTKWPAKILHYWRTRESQFTNQMSYAEWECWIHDWKNILSRSSGEHIKSIQELFAEIQQDFLVYQEALVTPILLFYLQEIHHHYQLIKKQMACLDYHDLIRMLCEALEQNEEFRYRMQHEIEALMIDEYQDTDGLQKRLVDLIITTRQETKGNLFVVGDPKQSIYRFRGADVSIFLDTQQELISQGKGSIYLTHNYRSQSEIVQFTNELCQRVFPIEDYYPIQSSRFDNQSVEKPVQILYSGISEDLNLDVAHLTLEEREAYQICEQILRLNQDDHKSRSFGEMVLLLRKMNDSALYEKILRSCGIPARVVGGRGFYQIQEISDFIYLFSTLIKPVRAEAWVGVLRSPFVHMSEEGLTRLALDTRWIGTPQDWWEMKILEEDDQRKLQQFILLHQSLQQLSLRRAPGQLIRWVMEKSHYITLLWSLPNGSQAVANLEKWCAEWESETDPTLLTLEGFLAQMEFYQEKAEDESEAEVWDEGEDVVRIMTIHKSKGLEFPVVFLPNLHKASNKTYSQEYAIIHPELGLVIKGFKHLEAQIDFNEKVELLSWMEACNLEKEQDQQELKRLFYVAATRAEDYLFLCLPPQEEKTKDNIASMLGKEFQLGQYERESELPFGSCVLPIIRHQTQSLEPEKNTSSKITQLDFTPTPLPESESDVENVLFLDESDLYYINPIPYGKQDHIPISVTDWKELVHCPRKYYYHRVIQVPLPLGVGMSQSWDSFDEDWGMEIESSLPSYIPGNRRGEIIHYLCEKTVSPTERLWLQPDWMVRVAQHFHLTASDVEILKPDLEQIRARFLDSKVVQRIAQAKNVSTEEPFQFVTPGFRVNGQVDLLLQSIDDRWEIIDFKSDKMKVEDVPEKTAFYLPQLQLYSLAIRAKGAKVSSVTLYFLDCNHEEQIQIDEEWWVQAESLLTYTQQYFQYEKKWSNWTAKPSGNCPYCEYNLLCEKASTEL